MYKKEITPQNYLNMRVSQMLQDRSLWEPHWKRVLNAFSARKGNFTKTNTNKPNLVNHIINNKALMAKRILTAGLMNGITNPATPWFKLAPSDPGLEKYGGVRDWLDSVERLIYRVFSSSNLYLELYNLYNELVIVGTAVMIQEENYDSMVRFTTLTAGEYALGINSELKVDSLCREYSMSIYQMVEQFGFENVSNRVQEAWGNCDYNSLIDVVHLIEPVYLKQFDEPQFKLDKEFNYRSIYYEKGETEPKLLRVKGYKEIPFVAVRWDKKPGDIYGHSPAMYALGDNIALQIKEKVLGQAIEKEINPPLTAPSSLKSSSISVLPGDITFTDNPNERIEPIYKVVPNTNSLTYDVERTQERINQALYADLFLLISNQEKVRTATEIASREGEKLQQLGPVLMSLHNEMLDPLIDRTFSIIMKESQRGWEGKAPMLLPPPPQELVDTDLKVDYISILAQAQKLVTTNSMERLIAFVGQLSQLDPNAVDMINIDGAILAAAETLSVSTSIIKNEEEIKQIRESRQMAVDQQQDQQAMGNVVNLANQLSHTDTANPNALTDMLGA